MNTTIISDLFLLGSSVNDKSPIHASFQLISNSISKISPRLMKESGRSSGGGTGDDGGAGATQPLPWVGGGGIAPGRCWLPSLRAGGSAGLCCLACRRPGPVPAAVATGWQRCRHGPGPPGRRRRAKRLVGPGLSTEQARRATVAASEPFSLAAWQAASVTDNSEWHG